MMKKAIQSHFSLFIIRFSLLTLFIFSLALFTVSARPNLDSLWSIWTNKTQPDTIRLNAISNIANGYLNSNRDSAFYFAQLQYDFAKRKGLKKQMATALYIQGGALDNSEYTKALACYQKSIKILEEIGKKRLMAGAIINSGIIYMGKGDIPKALNFLQKGIAICEGIGEKEFLSVALRHAGYIYYVQFDYYKSLGCFQRSLKIDEETGDKEHIVYDLNYIGSILSDQGNFIAAVDYQKRSLAIYEELGDTFGIAGVLVDIGNIYQRQHNDPKAREYYQRSLPIFEELGKKSGIAASLINIGETYTKSDKSKALEYFQKGIAITEQTGDSDYLANALISIASIHKDQGDYPKAMEYYQRALKINEEIGAKNGIASSSNHIGHLLNKQNSPQQALTWCEKGLKLSRETGTIFTQKSACECLYKAYKTLGNGNKALQYHEQMLTLDDSLKSAETAKKLDQMEFRKKILADSMKQEQERLQIEMTHREELQKEGRTRNIAIGAGIFFILLAGGFYSRWRYVRKAKARIEKEKDRSENLLLNILPAEIAEELKEKGRADARDFDMVSILFTDFKEFTQTSEKLSAKELVEEINTCFEAFDKICEKYKIEKIKTIGDSYMAAGGIPVPTGDSVKNTVLAGLEMAAFMLKRKAKREAAGQIPFYMRVGIHTGPVVAGIVGVKKFQYDIWGDTVNTASRMESHGEVGKVNISQSTYELIKDDSQFQFESRGKVPAKGKGEVEMYFVSVKSDE